MKRIRASVPEKILAVGLSLIIISAFIFFVIYIHDICALIIFGILSVFFIIFTIHIFYRQIEFDDQKLVYRSIFRKFTIYFNEITKICNEYYHLRGRTSENLVIYTEINKLKISKSSENYSDFERTVMNGYEQKTS